MIFHSVLLPVAVLALSRLAWTAEPATAKIVLDAQLGPYPVSVYEHEVKTSRPDPLAPTQQLRRLMVTVYRPFLDNFTCPLEDQSHIPYIPPVVAAALLEFLPLNLPSSSSSSTSNASSIFAPLQLVNCSRPVPSSQTGQQQQLLLFSPGLGGTHHIYASTLQAAASSGYTVVAIDHTYEAAAVVFPDGQVAYANASADNITDVSDLNFLQGIRDADTVSVLDAIERGDVPGLGRFSNSSSVTNSTSSYSSSSSSSSDSSTTKLRTVMYGHSLGGSTAANIAASDSRVLGAINIDGTFFGPVANGTVRKPLLMLGSAPQDTPEWVTFYSSQHVRGWKTWVHPANTVHYGYTDLPLLVDLLGLQAVVPQNLTGTVDSRRLQEIVWRYTTQFFEFVLKGAETDLLDGPSADFPDVDFIGHKEAEKGP